MTNEASSGCDIVGVLYDKSIDIDAILIAVVEKLRFKGVRIAGLLQRLGEFTSAGKRSMFVEDLSSGERIRLDQPRGSEASGCMLDPDALAKASHVIRSAIASRPEVLVVNRFGQQEAEGHGLRPELAEAVGAGVTTIVPVSRTLVAQWQEFVGESGRVVEPNPPEIIAWVSQRISAH
ncbi:MAG TPA: DUF2478 domain-containing protein [Candidatus Binataceae bacterium]|nr:DUF2478 domain-containing protein [Candidatus Binataceae bacterium]